MAVVHEKGSKHQGRTCQQSLGIPRPSWEKGRIWDCPSSLELEQGTESEVQEGIGRVRTKLHKPHSPCPRGRGDPPRTIACLLHRFDSGPDPTYPRKEGGLKQKWKDWFFRKTTLRTAKP